MIALGMGKARLLIDNNNVFLTILFIIRPTGRVLNYQAGTIAFFGYNSRYNSQIAVMPSCRK
jgi:hypothetical protein